MKIKMIAALMTGFVITTSSIALAKGRSDVAPVDNPKYAKECSACHMAYQPGLLPERSWRKLMDGLDKHFGENAELPDADRQELTDYLAKNAADHAKHKRSAQLAKSIAKNDTPLRITEVPFFTKEHRKVATKIKGSDKVKSLSQCDVCHQKANDGSFAEGEINIPGIGRWGD